MAVEIEIILDREIIYRERVSPNQSLATETKF